MIPDAVTKLTSVGENFLGNRCKKIGCHFRGLFRVLLCKLNFCVLVKLLKGLNK